MLISPGLVALKPQSLTVILGLNVIFVNKLLFNPVLQLTKKTLG